MMTTHVASVAACWLIALIGLAMLVRASEWKGRALAHGAVVLSLFLLSAMALDHDHKSAHAASGTTFVAGNQSDWYHVATCPLVAHQKLPLVPLKDEHEARDSGRSPHECVASLATKNAQYGPHEDGEDRSHTHTGE